MSTRLGPGPFTELTREIAQLARIELGAPVNRGWAVSGGLGEPLQGPLSLTTEQLEVGAILKGHGGRPFGVPPWQMIDGH
jgi:hypothetical protein